MTTQSIEGAMPPLPTHEELELFAAEMVRNGQLSWLGFRQDTDGLYTIPVVSPASAKLTLAYAKAYAAPLLARVAKLEALLFKARAGLANGLWDYGPGQDEHAQCNALIKEIDAALAAHKEQP